jgi:hypothetical protein
MCNQGLRSLSIEIVESFQDASLDAKPADQSLIEAGELGWTRLLKAFLGCPPIFIQRAHCRKVDSPLHICQGLNGLPSVAGHESYFTYC